MIAAQVVAIVFLCLFLPALLPWALFLALFWLMNLICACIIFTRKGAPDDSCGWFIILTAFPIFGALAYFIINPRRQATALLKIDAEGLDGRARAVNALCGTVPANYAHAEYFADGAAYFSALITAIEGAKKAVYLEYFIVERGVIFDGVLSALKKARSAGAEIKIIADGVGSAFKLRRKDVKALKKLGAEVKVFHRITPLARARLNVRDHRKIAAIDGKIAFTGGINLADEYANLKSPYGFWKDTGVAVYGKAARVFEGMFLAMWEKEYALAFPAGGGEGEGDPHGPEKSCLPFYDSPPRVKTFERVVVSLIEGARERVHIFTPYFCPSERVAESLKYAARRGVDVKIILPHIPDKKYAYAVSKRSARAFLESGVQFYEFTPGFMHAKSVICDSEVVIGSYNLDYRSTRYNCECGAIFGEDICEEVERDFAATLALSQPLSSKKASVFGRFFGAVLGLFSPLM